MDLSSARAVARSELHFVSEGAEKAISDAEKVAASQEKVGRSADVVAITTDKASKSILSAEGSYKRLLTSVDKQFRAQSQLASGQARLDRAFEQGVIDAREYDRVMGLMQQRFTVLRADNDNYAASVGGLGARLGLLGGAFAAAAAAAAGITQVLSPGAVLAVSREFENLEASLRTVTGSAENAKTAMGFIDDFAVRTPFNLQQVTEAFIRLKSLGLEAGEDALTSYGNTASAMGKPIMQMIEAVADAVTGEFERLKEFGIRAKQSGEQVTFTFQGVSKTVGKSSAEIAKYLQDIGNQKFAGAMDEQMKTLGGALSNAEDAIARFQREIGRGGFSDAVKEAADSLAQFLSSNGDLARGIGAVLAEITRTGTQIGNEVAGIVTRVIKQVEDLRQWAESLSALGGGILGGAKTGADATSSQLGGYFQQFDDFMTDLLGPKLDALVADLANSLIGGFVGAYEAVVASWGQLPAAFGQLGAGAGNALLSGLETMVNTAIGWINAIIRAVNTVGGSLSEVGTVQFKRFESGASEALGNVGEAAKKAFTTAMNTDYVGSAAQAVKGLVKPVADLKSAYELAGAENQRFAGRLSMMEADKQAKSMGSLARATDAAGKAAGGAAKGAKEAASAYENLLQRTQDRIEELEMERRYVGQTTDAVIKLKLAHDLERAAKKSGIEVTADMRREWDLLGDGLAGATRRLEDAKEALKEIQEAQKFVGGLFENFIGDLISGSGKLEDALKGLADTFLKSGLQALLTGEGPLAGILGASATEKGQQGGLVGMLMGNDVKLFRETIAKGTSDGLKDFGNYIGPRTSDEAAAGLINGTGISGKELMGGITALASIGAAYGSGLSSGSPMMGAATGALSGALGGAMAGMAIPVIGPIVGAIIGGVLGGGSGFLGGSSAQKQRKDELKRQAEENYQAAKPQVAQLGQLFRGDDLGNIQQQIQAGIDKLNELGPVLVNAGHVDELIALQNDYNTFVSRMKDEFRADFDGTIEELRAGLGAQGPFKQASDAVKQFGDSAKTFIADTKTAFGDGAWQIDAARDASIAYALSMLDQAKTLTEVQQSIQSINGTAAGLSKVLQDLGMSAEDAANAINQRVGAAMDRLRSAFTDGLERRLNEASDRGYINEISDQIAQYRKDLSDAAALGLDGALAAKVFAAEAQQIVNGAELAGDAFNALVQQFPELAGVVKEFSQALADMGNDLAAIAQRQQGYYDRIFNAANDNSTLEGALKAFDRQAQREREAEVKAGGQAITDLELALAAERVKIVNDFAAKAKAAEQQAAEQAARAAQQKVDEAQRAVDDARSDLQRAYEQQASSIRAIVTRLEGVSASIRKIRNDLRFDDALSPYNDRQQQKEAEALYQDVRAKALAGDQTAMDQLADAARRYLEESKAYYGFNEVYARIFEEVQSTLEAVGSKAQSELDIARAQLSALDAQVSGLLTVNDSVLTVAAGIEKLNAAVAALAAAQAAQIGNGTGTPDQRTAYVTSLYQKYFGRQPDQAGLDFWVKSDLSTSQLDQAFADAKAAGAMRLGGIVGAYARGGLIGNGIFDVDSVIARYAGGGNIALAGGEYVMPAHQTRANLPVLEAMRTGRAPANDDSAKEEIRALRSEVANLTGVVQQLLGQNVEASRATASAVNKQTVAIERQAIGRR
ncbi:MULTISPECIES: tape measure protein [unclassified Chelatococcus]|uniref:tape measure protein n=1 Tax=unclassified Chelatococcus TaxID=2638111 RepID=UPI001BD03828|nr:MULTISPECIES: tape measure protein [unclassified Chelatococcus]CAH1670799.1 hypothetical protein CHELA41_23444 [Hyphomicrobiales bacterium]MBS7738381.1 DUF4214 domain-containing protein [Chelatococcus sp. HY11]MBX3547349.1 DUF4214 domain-containing protein [Chelatococcus sp.]MCO5077272.1 tape measure protein [Chelatococcus sp.]CAH1676981.1 hypothetical protein CHELA20_51570 [Hyphomicrobiales bacterium]